MMCGQALVFVGWLVGAAWGGVIAMRLGRHLLAGGTIDPRASYYGRYLLRINIWNTLRGRPWQEYITVPQMRAIGRQSIVVAWLCFASIPVCLYFMTK